MRPLFVGFALVWIVVTFVTSFRLMVNAPLIFGIFIIIPILCLIYGLLAKEPKPAKAPESDGKTP